MTKFRISAVGKACVSTPTTHDSLTVSVREGLLGATVNLMVRIHEQWSFLQRNQTTFNKISVRKLWNFFKIGGYVYYV